MKRIFLLSLMAIVGLGLAGCGEDEKEPRTISYFKQNPQIAQERIAECKKMERRSEKVDKDCRNASLGFEQSKN